MDKEAQLSPKYVTSFVDVPFFPRQLVSWCQNWFGKKIFPSLRKSIKSDFLQFFAQKCQLTIFLMVFGKKHFTHYYF